MRGTMAKIGASAIALGQGEVLVDENGGVYGGDGATLMKGLRRLTRTDEAPLVIGVSPTGTAAGDQAALVAAITKANTVGYGIIVLNAGVFTPTGSLPAFDPRYVAIVGAGRNITIIRPTSGLTGDLFRAQGAAFGVDQASHFGSMTIDGVNAGDGACGLHWGDVNGGKLDKLDIRNFADTTTLTTPVGVDPTTLSKGLWIDNTRDALGITERLELNDVRLYSNAVNVLMTVKAGMPASNQSFYYQRWKHVQISAQGGQVGVWMKNCLMQGAELNIMANMGAMSGKPGVFLYLDGSGADHTARVLDADLSVHIETAGAAGTTTYGLLGDAGTSLTGQGVFSAYAGQGMTNQSAGTVNLAGYIRMAGFQMAGLDPWNVVSPGAPYTALVGDLVRVTTSDAVLLPPNPLPGQKVAISRDGTVTVTVNANTGQTINGLSQVKMPASTLVTQANAVLVALSSSTWRVEGTANTDLGLGFYISGALNIQGGMSMAVRTLTTAATISNADVMLYCTTPGQTHSFGTQTRTGQVQWVVNATSGSITLAAPAGGTINGAASITVSAQTAVTVTVSVGGASAVIVTSATSTGSGGGGASTADPLGWGIATNVGPVTAGGVARALVANQVSYYRLVGGASISKIRVHVGTSSGNIGVAVYSNTGAGLTSAPGPLLASSGSVACPAAGVADIALGATVTPNCGDWIAVWSDNATATIYGPSANGFVSSLYAGRAYRQTGVSGGPPSTVGTLNAGQSAVYELVGVS